MYKKVLNRKIRRGKFDLSHEFKFTCNMGEAIPVSVEEVVPGDKMKGNYSALVKLSSQIAPVMHNVNVYFRSFYVPNRLLWKNWESFITGGKNNTDASVHPYIKVNGIRLGDIYDFVYGGLPVNSSQDGFELNALPLRAYNLIMNTYFRDQALQDPLTVSMEDGQDSTQFAIQKVLWEKDYFTSARANPQAGSGAILPIGDKAPVFGNGKAMGLYDGSDFGAVAGRGSVTLGDGFGPSAQIGSDVGTPITNTILGPGKTIGLATKEALEKAEKELSDTGLEADLSSASPVSIEQLRNAFKIQEILEKLNRSGHHMRDWLMAFFGVKASDARLQEPEYLGGGYQPILFSEVLQTSETGTTPLGTQAGHSSSFVGVKEWKRYFEEHGWVITIMYIRPRTDYMQGIQKQFLRSSRYDYYLPEFANLGEQEVKNIEIFATGTADNDNATFGYQTRFQEMRSRNNRIAGQFRDTLKYWHMAREFENAPQLNEQFLECDPTKRIFATAGMDNHCFVDLAIFLYANRPLPKYVKPATLF